MRVLVFFDLPVGTAEERKNANTFRKFLIREGFIMMQESVYSKIALHPVAARTVIARVKLARPPKGLIQALTVTEKQFASMELIVGKAQREVVDTEEKVVIL